MDEPTTHLDIASIDALVHALKQFEGTLVFISHDVYFIRALASQVLHVHAGCLTTYAGDYDYYLDKSKATNERAALTAGFTDARPVQIAAAKVTAAPKPVAGPKLSAGEIRKLRTEVGKLEEAVAALEAKQTELAGQLESPESYTIAGRAQQLNRELSAVTDQIQQATQAWEEAEKRLEEAAPSSG